MLIRKCAPLSLLVLNLTLSPLLGCSTAEVAPDTSVMPEVPDYVKVPHPQGYEMAEIRTLFENPLAPKAGLTTFSETCDEDFRKLTLATTQKQDRREGAQELVTLNAEKMHWCFYGKVERMQKNLKAEQNWGARQKIVLETYEFLTPIATAFLTTYHDSRYMRWATQYYSNISEWIFFRKVVPGPENTLALTTSASTDLETWTANRDKNEKKLSVFARFGIDLKKVEDENAAPAEAERAPASAAPPIAVEDVEVAPAMPEVATQTEHAAAVPETLPLDTKPAFSAQIPDMLPTPLDGGVKRRIASPPSKSDAAVKP